VIEYRYAPPALEDWLDLRAEASWSAIVPRSRAQAAMDGSWAWISAYDGDDCVGMARVVGDGAYMFYLQDVLVRGDRRGKGIGGELVRLAVALVSDRGSGSWQLGLMAAGGKEPFYERFGFKRRPDDNHGAGMILRGS